MNQSTNVNYQIDPSQYKHWSVKYEGEVATLQLNINEDGGIRPGYKLKLNSYDLGVDIELYDALNRIRFEHPEVKRRSTFVSSPMRLETVLKTQVAIVVSSL